MYRGRWQLGASLPVALQCVTAAEAPALPDNPPLMKVWSNAALLFAQEMPIFDRYVQTGYFATPMFLDSRFVVGLYKITYHYRVGADHGFNVDTFEVVPGGDVNGQSLSMYFYRRPQADFIVYGTASGKIIQGRNPTVR